MREEACMGREGKSVGDVFTVSQHSGQFRLDRAMTLRGTMCVICLKLSDQGTEEGGISSPIPVVRVALIKEC